MGRAVRLVGRGLVLLLVFGVLGVAGVLAHELGHAAVAEALGGTWDTLNVAPGYTVYPPDRIGPTDWNGTFIAWVEYRVGEDWLNWHRGLVGVAGSMTTCLLSVTATLVLYRFRPRGIWRWVVSFVCCWLFFDLLRYSAVSMIGPWEPLRNPGLSRVISCPAPPWSLDEDIPSGLTEPRLYLRGIGCRSGRPEVHFALVGTAEVARATPVFFVLETPAGPTWAAAEQDRQQPYDDAILYSYRADTGDGEYGVSSGFAVVDGLRGSVVFGGADPEPLRSAVQMGIHPGVWLSAVGALATLQAILLIRFWLLARGSVVPAAAAKTAVCS